MYKKEQKFDLFTSTILIAVKPTTSVSKADLLNPTLSDGTILHNTSIIEMYTVILTTLMQN